METQVTLQNLNKPFMQLVCFYFVLTTFTTVGYGEKLKLFYAKVGLLSVSNNLNDAGDISAINEAERVITTYSWMDISQI